MADLEDICCQSRILRGSRADFGVFLSETEVAVVHESCNYEEIYVRQTRCTACKNYYIMSKTTATFRNRPQTKHTTGSASTLNGAHPLHHLPCTVHISTWHTHGTRIARQVQYGKSAVC